MLWFVSAGTIRGEQYRRRKWREAAPDSRAELRDGSRRSFLQCLGAAPQRRRLVLGHLRFENLSHTAAPEDARQRNGSSVFWIEAADGYHRSLVAQNDFGHARGHHADAELAGIISLDNRDVGKADFLLDALTELF